MVYFLIDVLNGIFFLLGKEGRDAYVEVDLLHIDSVVTIRRTLTSENKSSKWHINRKLTTQTGNSTVATHYKSSS